MLSDWVFASSHARGKQPYWPINLMKLYIRPAAREAGIHKNIAWHTFRTHRHIAERTTESM